MKKHVLIQGFAVNRSKIQRTTIHGRKTIILKDTLACRGDSVMNGLYYSDEFVSNHYHELNNTFAPIGHPRNQSGELIPSTEPMAVNAFYGGAWNRNPRKDQDKQVFLDIYLDEEYAANTEKGQAALQRISDIESGKESALWTSTALYYQTDDTPGMTANGVQYYASIIDGHFEHNAILLDEMPAGGDTGFTINSELVEVVKLADDRRDNNIVDKVINFFGGNDLSFNDIQEMINQKLQEMSRQSGSDEYVYAQSVFRNYFIYRSSNGLFRRKYKLSDGTIEFGDEEKVEPTFKKISNSEDTAMNEEEMKKMGQLMANAVADAVKGQNEQFTTVLTELKDEIKSLNGKIASNAEVEHNKQRKAIKEKFGFSDEAVAELTGNALSEMYAKTQTAAPIHSGFSGYGANADNVDKDILDMEPAE